MNVDLSVIGSTGLRRQDGIVHEEWHSKLQGRRGASQFREMIDMDSTIGAAMLLMRSLIRQVRWHVEPSPDSGSRGDAEATFLESCMGDMSHTWEDTVGEGLSMLPFGWCLLETVYKYRLGQQRDPSKRSKYADGRIGWRKLARRSQESLSRWDFDDDGEVLGMYQTRYPDFAEVFIPIDKAILLRTEIDKNNPEGRSILRPIWRSWYFLKRLQELEAIGTQKDMVGTPVAWIPEEFLSPDASPGQKATVMAIQKAIARFHRNEQEGFVFPLGYDVNGNKKWDMTLLHSGGRRQIDLDASIKRYARDMSIGTLTQFLFLGSDGVGSFALSSDMTNITSTALGSVLDSMQEDFNRQAVTPLMDLNGVPEEVRPRLVHGDIEKEDVVRFSQTLSLLTKNGLLTPDSTLEDFIRTKIGLPDREDPVDPAFDIDRDLDPDEDPGIDPKEIDPEGD